MARKVQSDFVAELHQQAREKLRSGQQKQAEISVPGVPNLKVVAYPSETVWVHRFRFGGKRDSVSLGDLESMSLAQAIVAVERNRELIASGRNPKKIQRTLQAFVDGPYMDWAKSNKRSWRNDETRWRLHVAPLLGHRLLSQINSYDLQRLVDGLQGKLKPATVNRVVALLKKIFGLGGDWGFCQADPTKTVKQLKERNERLRVLNASEIHALIAASQQEPYRLAALLVCFLLYTGTRLNEALGARWVDFDEEAAVLRLPDTKNGKVRIAHLSQQALAIVTELRGYRRNQYLFPGRSGDSHMARPTRAFERMKAAAGISNLWLHDLRRTFGSTAANAGVPIYTLMEILGHSSPRVTARYALLTAETLRSASATVGAALQDAAEGTERAGKAA